MTSNEIRSKYLEFFKSRGHAVVPSASLTPENDPTTLFTGSGMQPLIPYLLGQKHPLGSRVANSQKCFRAEDIDEVGDNRHTTFFEMLGNWSFGSYWKEEQLPWFFEFLTGVVGLPKDRLWVTCFEGDEESGIPRDTDSAAIWKGLGILEERIRFYDAKKNWWSRAGIPVKMPAGEPGGPDSEVFYDFGTKHDTAFGKECHPNCDCGRFMEIGNSVFMEYKKREDGKFEKLAQRNVDFGGGLERIAAASNGDPDIFKIDIFTAIGETLKAYTEAVDLKRKRIIMDHLRASVHLIAAGVEPSNKEKGYILRRLLRRAIFHVMSLTQKDALIPLGQRSPIGWDERTHVVINAIVIAVVKSYPELQEQEERIKSIIVKEIGKFTDVLKSRSELEKVVRGSSGRISGRDAFILFSTFGLPIDYIKDEAQRFKLEVDEVGFREELKKHQELSRTTSAGVFKGGLADHSEKGGRC